MTTLTNIPPRAIFEATAAAAAVLSEQPDAKWSLALNVGGDLFVTVAPSPVTTDWPLVFWWAYIDRTGLRAKTPHCEESAIREGCRLGPWYLETVLDAWINGSDSAPVVNELPHADERARLPIDMPLPPDLCIARG